MNKNKAALSALESMLLEDQPQDIPRFYDFVRDAWHILEPSTPFVDGWHIHAISEHLEAVSSGQIQRLLVNMPPRHAKSTLISVMWPVWSWLLDPSLRWLCASYALSLSIRDNRRSRILIQSPWFQSRYGHIFRLAGDQNMKSRFENDKRGYRLATSVGAATTGEGGDRLLIDDPHPASDATSDVQRLNALQWFNETWVSRLNDQKTGAMVVVGQRIHQQDVSGHILELGGWEHLNLPTEFEEATRCRTSLGWTDPRKEEGELLWPERFDHESLARLKKQLGSQAYAAQYQQTPVPSGGGQFRREWFRYFRETADAYLLEGRAVIKAHCERVFITVDLAISSKQHADYTVFGVWAMTPEHDLLLLDVIRGRFSNPEQFKLIQRLHHHYPHAYFKIEKVGYQLALVQQALSQGIPCKEYQPVRDKVTRASTASIWFENGKIYFRQGGLWLHDLETELLLFPKGAHDDQVDVISMAAEEATNGQRDIEPLDIDTAQALSGFLGY
ncbi:phage terminase large subunit [Thermosporothrix hazakensis]|uniref:phage terminase large subunit n=1 Tax=Thermosporothrix hazakensis TaxID=644383 RepID=UPI0014760DCE|nr:phage terminase large subunit [Thermosporothrix hazakensis]